MMPQMVRPVLKVAVLAILITAVLLVHQGAKLIVGQGLGIPALIILLLSTPILSRYLD